MAAGYGSQAGYGGYGGQAFGGGGYGGQGLGGAGGGFGGGGYGVQGYGGDAGGGYGAPAVGVVGLTNEQINEQLQAREKARMAKDFQTADAIRDQLAASGVYIDDRTRSWRTQDGRTGNRPDAF